MAYIAPIHRASGVRHALKLNLIDPEEECLVVAKSNRLEVYLLSSQGLILRHSRAVHGQITMLEKVHPASAMTDHLFVCTDQHDFFTLSWDAASDCFRTERSYLDKGDKTARDSQSYDRCFIDPKRRFLTMSLYEGVYSIIIAHYKPAARGKPLVDIGSLADDVVPVRVGEILIRSSAYLHYREGPEHKNKPTRLATLYQDTQDRAWLKVRNVIPTQDLEYINLEDEKILLRDKLDPTASHLIPVQQPIYGLLVLAETCITWIDDENSVSKVQPLSEPTVWSTWTEVDENRWLLGDEYGSLYFLMIEYDHSSQEISGFKLDKLGRTSKASTLVYLDSGYVFVGSHSGDSQVIQIAEAGFQVVQTLSNIGPIIDFAVMDMGSRGVESQVNEFSSGQARLVTGSGAFGDGSLRSVRSGVGVDEIGSIDLADGASEQPRTASNMFHVPIKIEGGRDDLLVISYVDETRIFRFGSGGDIEETQEMVTNEPTIFAKSFASCQFCVQCTSRSLTMYEHSNGHLKLVSHWQALNSQNIVAAASSAELLTLSLGGMELVTLDISEVLAGQGQIQEVGRRQFNQLISCIDMPATHPSHVIAGFWESTSLSVLELPSLGDVHSTKISDERSAVPRSVLLTQVLANHSPILFVSVADGHIITFDVDQTSFELTNRQTTILGSQHANLKILDRADGLSSVFAIGDHSTLIYGSEGRLVYSAVTAEDASCISSFNTALYPGAVALALPSQVKIAAVERERTTHVQTLPMGETVRRIAYSAELHAFGMGTIKRDLIDGEEIVTSSFKLVDEIVFDVLDEYRLSDDEIVESACRARLQEDGKLVERFVVGTTYLAPDDDEERSRGRIMVFQVAEDRKLVLVTEHLVKGACRALAILDGRVVAALVKTLTVYAYEYGSLQRKASYRCATAPIDVYVEGNHIVISDLMKSVAVVSYTKGSSGSSDRLEEVARHFQTCWSTAIAPVGEGKVLESDAEGNLLLLAPDTTLRSEGEKERLEVISELNLGEMVNKMRPIQIPDSSTAIVMPRAFLVTINGGIYMFGEIRANMRDELIKLQDELVKEINSPGNIPWSKWRACRTAVEQKNEPLRFVDGDVLEAFLECDEQVQEKVAAKLNVTVAQITETVETLRRMH